MSWVNQIQCCRQRVRTSRGEMGGATLLPCQIEPNWPLPYNPCQYDGWGMPGRRAGSPVSVYARVHCWEPKTGQNKVQFYCKDDWLWPSCYYLSMYGRRPLYLYIQYLLYSLQYEYDIHYTVYSLPSASCSPPPPWAPSPGTQSSPPHCQPCTRRGGGWSISKQRRYSKQGGNHWWQVHMNAYERK